jgi:hypothetical protein
LLSTLEWQKKAACSFAGANIVHSKSSAAPGGAPTPQPFTTTATPAHAGHQKRTATPRQ